MTNEARPDTEPTEAHRDKVKRALKMRARLDAIRRTGLADSGPAVVPAFERAARLAANALGAPVAQVNLLTDAAQIPLAAYAQAPDDPAEWRLRRQAGSSYCKYVIWTRQPFVVEDAQAHLLVRHSHATRELDIRAYLGVPVRAPAEGDQHGAVIGSLCVIDHRPRQWSSRDVEILLDLASSVADEIEHRLHLRREIESGAVQAARILESVGMSILVTDAQGVTTYANRAALTLLGYSDEEIVGHDLHALVHHSRPDGSRYPERDCPNYAARKAGESAHVTDDTYWRSDGSSVIVDGVMTPVFDRGEVVGSVVAFLDVSERSARESLERTGRLGAEAANRAKTALLAEMSRELRATLGNLAVNLDRMDATLVNSASPDQRLELANIQRGLLHLSGLVDNLSGFATIEQHATPE